MATRKQRGNNGNIKKEKILYNHDVDSEKAAVQKIIKALINNRGRQYLAARELGISRKTLWSYRQRWPEIEEITQEFRGQLVDTAEKSLETAAENGESWAVTFVLNCLARDRGYGNQSKLEVTGADGQSLLEPLAAALDKAYGQRDETTTDEAGDEVRELGA